MYLLNLRASAAYAALVCGLAAPAFAQNAQDPAAQAQLEEIIVTATKRAQSLQDVPIAVSAVTAESMARSGASDIRALNQLAPSLLVSSTSSEAGGGAARIRGVGTVGDNPGLESSVATFIDGVYRNRTGVGLTELGSIERVEVLRGPQGTLFGRNASAGLINIVTQEPQYNFTGYGEASYGNYDALKLTAGVSGGVSETVALGLDGVFFKRDGFLKNTTDGGSLNNRDRWMLRGQALIEPNENITLRLIADYADRDEQCCGAVYQNAQTVTKDANGNIVISDTNSIYNLLQSLGANITEGDLDARQTSITSGRDYRSDVKDWGVSAQLDWDFGGATLTSITAYRDWHLLRGQDADFNKLDLLYRDGFDQQFKTLSQEVRLAGTLGRLDWLVGGYFSNEQLDFSDNLKFGNDYGTYAACQVVGAISSSFISAGSSGCISATGRATVNGLFGASTGGALLTGLDQLYTLRNQGISKDSYDQQSRNWAFFTHNVFEITDKLSATVGVRYTDERKTLDADIRSDSTVCGRNVSTLGALTQSSNSTVRSLSSGILSLSCAINTRVDGAYSGKLNEGEWTGTGVLSFKATPDLLGYASFSRGYKAGGFNLDRAGISSTSDKTLESLKFGAETVDAYEVGAKYSIGVFSANVAVFHQKFSDFQLNTFNGTNFIVENVSGVTSKGVEIETQARPTGPLTLNLGYTYASTKYDEDLTGLNGRALPAALSQLPGQQISNAPKHVLTGGAGLEIPVPKREMTVLLYADYRYQSEINTGSDLDSEKIQPGYATVNGRIGFYGPERRWGVEFWGQNLFDVTAKQVAFDAPIQGSNSRGLVEQGAATSSTQLFGAFLNEPRTFGVTLKGKF